MKSAAFSRWLSFNHIQKKTTPCCGVSRSVRPHTSDNARFMSSTSPPKRFKDIPGPKGLYDLPYLGMGFHFKPFGSHSVEKAAKLFLDLRTKYDKIMRQRIGSEHYVFLFDPEDFEHVFKAEGPYPYREALHIVTTYCGRNNRPIGMNGLNGEEWSKLRKPTQDKMLRPQVVTKYLPVINQVTHDLVTYIESKGEIQDINKLMLDFALENAGILAFNKRLGLLDTDDKSSTLKEDFGVFFRLLSEHFFLPPLYKYFRTPFYKTFEKAANGIYNRFDIELEAVKSEMESSALKKDESITENQCKSNTLHEYYSTSRPPDFAKELLADERLTEDYVRGVLLDIFIAGGDTTSSTLSGLLTNIAKHAHVQNRLFQEVDEHISDDGHVTQESLKKMPYLKSCVKESLRYLFPLPVGLARRIVKDIIIQGYKIPKNTYIVMGFNQVCRDPEIYCNPDTFFPERWQRGSDVRVRSPFALLPFGFGTRSCLGQRFAEQEIYVCIAQIIKKFEVSLPSDAEEIEYVHKLFAYPEKPVTICFKTRREICSNSMDHTYTFRILNPRH